MKTVRCLIVLCVFTMSFAVSAADGECYDPPGYTMECGAQCGQTPGTCAASEDRDDICLLTYSGYGCHSNSEEQCCNPRDHGF
jgi:hypothetical protein